MAVIRRQETTTVGEGAEEREALCTVGGNVNWCSRYGKQYVSFSKKSKLKLPEDPAIPPLSI